MVRLGLLWVLLMVGAAGATPPDEGSPARRVAPSPDDLAAETAALERRLDRAGVVHDALGLLQNELADRIGFGDRIDCRDAETASLVARARAFGQAHRDASQSARVQQERVRAIAGSETVRALVVGERAMALDVLSARAALEVRRQRDAAAWQWRLIEQRDGIEHCGVSLAEAAGLPSWRSEEHPVAVYVIGRGVELRSSAEALAGAVVER